MKPKVLLIQKYIPHYRIMIFELLSKEFDLDIIDSADSIQGDKDYSRLHIRRVPLIKIPKIGYAHACNMIPLANKYDAVIVPADSSMLSVNILRNSKHRKCKVISWGIGVLADRDHKYDSDTIKDKEFLEAINHSDSAVFYSEYPVRKYTSLGIDPKKLFVAPNTVFVNKYPYDEEAKRTEGCIVFLGSLYKVKRVDELVRKYASVLRDGKDTPDLFIIGDGEMIQELKSMINSLGLNDKVHIEGEITDDKILHSYFRKALACISPNQAGLSVLQSMGHGVPFITACDAITGGERFNISDNITGILFNEFDEIPRIIRDIRDNREKYINMGINCYNFYWKSRTPQNMVQGFINAVNYALNSGEE